MEHDIFFFVSSVVRSEVLEIKKKLFQVVNDIQNLFYV